MKKINTYIQEKLIITKNSKLKKITYIFKPKYYEASWHDLINELKVYLPFTIIAKNKHIVIKKIEWSDEFGFDAWHFIDENDKKVIAVTNAGVYKLFISYESINNHLYDAKDLTKITLDKNSCNMELPPNVNEKLCHQQMDEKLIINKDSKLRDPKDMSQWQVGDILAGTWGYSMTIPAFFEIIKRTGKSFTVVQRTGKIVSGHRNGQWEEVPDDSKRDKDLKSKPITARIRKWGGLKIDDTLVHLWNGEPLWGDDMD